VNRRDTIVISVLVNMALLVVLFVVAIKPSTSVEVAKVNLPQEKKVVVAEKPSLDQVDTLLSKFVAQEAKVEVPVVPAKAEEVMIIPPSNSKEIIVKQGDNLDKLAKTYHTSVQEIIKMNRLSDSKLHIGQILYVPKVEEPVPTAVPASVKGEVKYYVVKHGDNPWTIAIKNGLKVEELLKLNGLDESKAKKLKPGDKLRIQ